MNMICGLQLIRQVLNRIYVYDFNGISYAIKNMDIYLKVRCNARTWVQIVMCNNYFLIKRLPTVSL